MNKQNKILISAIISIIIMILVGITGDLLLADKIDWSWIAGGITGIFTMYLINREKR